MSKTALIIIADGTEEIEAVTPADVLVRAGIDVTVAGVGSTVHKGSRGIPLGAHCVIDDIGHILFDAIVLPGGASGAQHLHESQAVNDLVREHFEAGKIVAAICAAPAVVLAPLGILDKRHATCYPGLESRFTPEAIKMQARVVVDGNLITSRGPGTAMEFAVRIAEMLTDHDTSHRVAETMLARFVED